MTGITVVYDVTGDNYGHQPSGQLALYVTGSGGVPATEAQLQANPTAVLIDQTSASGTWDSTADVDDFENGAVSLGELASRARERLTSFKAGARPGQRSPAIYASAANLTEVANALTSAGITSGIGLWVANWNLSDAQATAEVLAASGPFPVIGIQYQNAGAYDVSVFSTAWLDNRSAVPATVSAPPGMTVKTPPPGVWKPGSTVVAVGLGPNGETLWATSTTDGETWNTPLAL